MENTLQITNGKITLNGVPVHCVKSFDLHTLEDYPCVAEINMTFDVPFSKMKAVNAKAEQLEEPHLNITIDEEKISEIQIPKPETAKKILYREFLGKQLAFLEYAQEDARSNGAFEEALAYSYKILELSREIEELDNHETVGESVDQSPIHQLETPTERKRLLRFAVEGTERRMSELKRLLSTTEDQTIIDEMHDLIEYQKQLEQELERPHCMGGRCV